MPESADEIGTLVSEFARTLDAHLPEGWASDDPEELDKLWASVVSGGWLELADSESAMHIRDVSLFVVAWGARLIPLPFAETLLVRRWTQVTPAETLMTVTLRSGDRTITPAAGPGSSRVAELPCENVEFLTDSPKSIDDFATSLLVGSGGTATELGPTQQAELRALLAAEAIGAAEQCLAKVAEYAQIRMAYGRPITAFQAIRHLLADMRINLDFAKSALFWALEAEGEDNRRAARLSADLCVKVGAGAFQVYGGIAYTWELGLHRYLRHIEAVRDVVS